MILNRIQSYEDAGKASTSTAKKSKTKAGGNKSVGDKVGVDRIQFSSILILALGYAKKVGHPFLLLVDVDRMSSTEHFWFAALFTQVGSI